MAMSSYEYNHSWHLPFATTYGRHMSDPKAAAADLRMEVGGIRLQAGCDLQLYLGIEPGHKMVRVKVTDVDRERGTFRIEPL